MFCSARLQTLWRVLSGGTLEMIRASPLVQCTGFDEPNLARKRIVANGAGSPLRQDADWRGTKLAPYGQRKGVSMTARKQDSFHTTIIKQEELLLYSINSIDTHEGLCR